METVGDCYVGVAGIPELRLDHAVAAVKFARMILKKMSEMTKILEVSLGPETADLDLRIGIHSGQVTAGVLRGERARFQLFGETVNTASRMETSGQRRKIHLSSATAELLKNDGKDHWVTPRQETVYVKGKGEIQTFWLNTKAMFSDAKKTKNSIDRRSREDEMIPIEEGTDETENGSDLDLDEVELKNGHARSSDSQVEEDPSKIERLVEWNVEILKRLLQQIVAARIDSGANKTSLNVIEEKIGTEATVLEEFQPIISLKRFGPEDLNKRKDPKTIDLGETVVSQLREFIAAIASMYRNNPFHNFEHASHVTASVRKLLSRIVNVNDHGLHTATNHINLTDLAGHSYGITSDPLTQFAVVFSAVIHDVDHPGVTNAQLVAENTSSAQLYKKSIAEQNSVDLAWEVLMSPEYADFRSCIYTTKDELQRFRQLVVNTVMATDICDRELQALRKARWEIAFSSTLVDSSTPEVSEDRKATIVIEHLIQASDIAHTMQHWQIYKQWNEKFFMEMYSAYKAGRAATDPSEGWYKGEIGFFDFYVIPLAKKLESCGVFGVSSHEYLNYAKSNRDEWVRDGEQAVREYIEKHNAMYPASP